MPARVASSTIYSVRKRPAVVASSTSSSEIPAVCPPGWRAQPAAASESGRTGEASWQRARRSRAPMRRRDDRPRRTSGEFAMRAPFAMPDARAGRRARCTRGSARRSGTPGIAVEEGAPQGIAMEGAAHSATSGAYPLLPADGCFPFPLYPYLNRLCTSSVQGCYRVMTRLNGSTEELLCQVFRQREQLGRAAASLFAAADTLHKSLRGRHDTTVPLLDTVPGSALVITINETGRRC